jgi:glycosyltransferase involved in cell wall biosynthesis
MRIGVGIHAPTSAAMEVGTIDLALALLHEGHDVTLFAEHGVELPARAAPLADRVARLPASRVELSGRARDALFLPARLEFSRRWARALADRPVDVIHAFSGGSAALIPREVAVVIQAWWHPARSTLRKRLFGGGAYGAGTFSGGSPVKRMLGPVASATRMTQTHSSDALGYRRAEAVVAVTEEAVAFLRAAGVPAEHAPLAVEVADEPPAREPAERVRVAFCAHPVDRPWKGLSYLLDALPLVREPGRLEVTIVGGWGEPEDPGVAVAREAGITVTTTGKVPRDDYLEILRHRTDVLAHPALWEEWGYSLFEALGLGVPAIAFDVYPYGELLDDRLGRVVPGRDTAAFAAALDDAVAGALPDPPDVLAEVTRRYGPAATVSRLLPIYEAAISRSRGASGRAAATR